MSDLAPTVDVGVALSAITKDPEWVKKYVIAGVVMLVPLVGPLVVLGWVRRCYEWAQNGDTESLPDLDFGADLSHGVAPFVAMLNLMVPAMVLAIGVWVVAAVLMVGAGSLDQALDAGGALSAVAGLFSIVLYLVFMLGMLLMNVAIPEVQRRGFNGEMGPLMSPGASLRAVMRRPGPYVMLLVGMFVANMIATIGVMLCYVGMFLTMPIAMVMVARLIAQWDAVVEHAQLEADELAALQG